MRRYFNTEGPVDPAEHYALDPLRRLKLDELMPLVEAKRYFVLHAPRQTGKTSVLKAWARHLNASGAYRAFYLNVEQGRAHPDDPIGADLVLASEWGRQADADGLDVDAILASSRATRNRLLESLRLLDCVAAWASFDPRPGVLLLDEVDTLAGKTLLSLLGGLRSGYANRPHAFPASTVLCGVRDIRDYHLAPEQGSHYSTGSPFNIIAESLTIGNFSPEETSELLAQHQEATGQAFSPQAVARLQELTEGQPWLVNALAKRVVAEAGPEATTYTVEQVDAAKEWLILRRPVHLQQLSTRLSEPRVARIIGPMLAGEALLNTEEDDLAYVRDLGLVVGQPPRIANPIYREVLPRALTATVQAGITGQEPAWYVKADGSLDLPKLLQAYGDFHRANIEAWSKQERYLEVAHQLLLQAFLQRLVNGGGLVEREYALGAGRTDLVVKWKLPDGRREAKVLELKVLRAKDGFEAKQAEGEKQTRAYMARMGAAEGHLVLFDARDPSKPFAEPSEPVDLGQGLSLWVF